MCKGRLSGVNTLFGTFYCEPSDITRFYDEFYRANVTYRKRIKISVTRFSLKGEVLASLVCKIVMPFVVIYGFIEQLF